MSISMTNPAAMIKQGAPHVIRSEKELAEYTEALFELTEKSDPTPEEEEAIELLTLLIERYEGEHYLVPNTDPISVLKFLLDQNGLSQRDIATELGSESTVSLILSGKRRLHRDHIERLSHRFHVSPSVFFGGVKWSQEKTIGNASLQTSIASQWGSVIVQTSIQEGLEVTRAGNQSTMYSLYTQGTNQELEFMATLGEASPWLHSSIPSYLVAQLEKERHVNEPAPLAA
jgi:HTH-type transcriptional regulator/antitoxin HigA